MEQYIEFFTAHPILSGIWLVLLFALVFTFMQSRFSAFSRVNSQQLTHLINRENALVIDIRSQDEYKKGHIAGAKQADADQVENVKGLEKAKDKPIIIVCAAGMTASKAANQLAQAGYQQVSILEGGMGTWKGANLPVAKG